VEKCAPRLDGSAVIRCCSVVGVRVNSETEPRVMIVYFCARVGLGSDTVDIIGILTQKLFESPRAVRSAAVRDAQGYLCILPRLSPRLAYPPPDPDLEMALYRLTRATQFLGRLGEAWEARSNQREALESIIGAAWKICLALFSCLIVLNLGFGIKGNISSPSTFLLLPSTIIVVLVLPLRC
jgi:hypothetical protein